MLTALVVTGAMIVVFVVALGLAWWSEHQREARIRERELRQLAIAESMRHHPSVIGKGFRAAA
jgi:hypothetical protein